MINWFDMPAEGLSNGGQFEVKELEVTENGTYEEKGEMYNKVTVNVEGGGSSWQTVFEGSVTTEADDPAPIGTIQNVPLTANTIKVTFNGTEYECGKYANGSYGAPFDEDTEQFDFSDYPFSIGVVQVAGNPIDVYTETAGTYTLKIEEPQSGGSSDFSTAEVVVNSELENIQYLNIVSVLDGQISALITNNFIMMMDSTVTYQVPLYKGLCIWSTAPGWNYNISVTGDITFEQGRIMIRGNGTITIS